MILSAKYLITGDGKTILENYGVKIGSNGRIEKIAHAEELKKEYPEEMIQ